MSRFGVLWSVGLLVATPLCVVSACTTNSTSPPGVSTPDNGASGTQGEPGCGDPSNDRDGDGFCRSFGQTTTTSDCNDSDPNSHPGGTEVCNLRDDDCDGVIDNGATAACPLSCDTPADGCETVTALVAGWANACALTSVGRVLCWGNGELGTPHVDASAVPLAVPGVANATAIVSSGSNTCALVGAQAICWGSASAYTYAIALPADTKQIAVSETAIFALLADGSVSWRALAPGAGDQATFAVLSATPQAAVMASSYRVCMVDAMGVLDCPEQAAQGNVKVPAIAAAGVGLVTVTLDDSVCYTKGSDLTCVNLDGVPRVIAGNGSAMGVAQSKNFACAFNAAGKTSCWSATGPHTIADAQGLAIGKDFGCVLRKSGKVSCWGLRSSGALGDGKVGPEVEQEPVDISTAAVLELPSTVLLTAQPLGACDSQADVVAMHRGYAPGVIHSLFTKCAAQCKDRLDEADCLVTCAVNPGLSAGCFACFAGLAACQGADCYDAFDTCAGFPVDFIVPTYNAPRFGCKGAECLVGAPLGSACKLGTDCLSGACGKLSQFADHNLCVVRDGASCGGGSNICECTLGQDDFGRPTSSGYCGFCLGEGQAGSADGNCYRACTSANYCQLGEECRFFSDNRTKYCY